jgi:hypothetical protein
MASGRTSGYGEGEFPRSGVPFGPGDGRLRDRGQSRATGASGGPSSRELAPRATITTDAGCALAYRGSDG